MKCFNTTYKIIYVYIYIYSTKASNVIIKFLVNKRSVFANA